MFYKKNDENVLSAANQYFDDFKRLDVPHLRRRDSINRRGKQNTQGKAGEGQFCGLSYVLAWFAWLQTVWSTIKKWMYKMRHKKTMAMPQYDAPPGWAAKMHSLGYKCLTGATGAFGATENIIIRVTG